LKSLKEVDLFQELDCICTPRIEDFDFKCPDKTTLMAAARKLAIQKNFGLQSLVKAPGVRRQESVVKFRCSHSPFFGGRAVTSISTCPFFLEYRFDNDEEEFYLESFDEMHNHSIDQRIGTLAFQHSALCKAQYPTPSPWVFNEILGQDSLKLIESVRTLSR
jgi:hypothetical protein